MNRPTENDKKRIDERQEALLVRAERFFNGKRVPKKLAQAFLDTPRHLFAQRFYSSKKGAWIDLSHAPLNEHLPEIYEDHPLCIFRDENGKTLSTISQPTFVLFMLDLLELQPGMKVFELGGGSGWNAAMMGRLVGKTGHVTSVEIIESMATSARSAINRLGIDQVEIISGDGSLGVSKNAPYQRGIFTASAWSLPNCFFDQIEKDGLLLFVMKINATTDLLAVLRKTGAKEFQSELQFPCSFVPVTGKDSQRRRDPIAFDSSSSLTDISWNQVKIDGCDIPDFIRFVELIKDCQQSYLVEDPKHDYAEEFSGFSVDEEKSLVLFNESGIKKTGRDDSLIELRRAGKRWLKAGKPSIEDLKLGLYPATREPDAQSDQWLVRRENTVIRWRIA